MKLSRLPAAFADDAKLPRQERKNSSPAQLISRLFFVNLVPSFRGGSENLSNFLKIVRLASYEAGSEIKLTAYACTHARTHVRTPEP